MQGLKDLCYNIPVIFPPRQPETADPVGQSRAGDLQLDLQLDLLCLRFRPLIDDRSERETRAVTSAIPTEAYCHLPDRKLGPQRVSRRGPARTRHVNSDRASA
jgi:hypothetical protein